LHPTGGVLPYGTEKCVKAIVACFKLHNKCIGDRIPLPDVDVDEEAAANDDVYGEAQVDVQAQQLRRRLVQRFEQI
jgi:hypothetical protein